MKTAAVLPDLAIPALAWASLAWKGTEMLLASSQVIMHRSQRLAAAGPRPSARDRREFTRMGREKLDAATESARAIGERVAMLNAELVHLTMRQFNQGMGSLALLFMMPGLLLSGNHQQRAMRTSMIASLEAASRLSGAVARLGHHALDPIHSRATGNAKRLLKR